MLKEPKRIIAEEPRHTGLAALPHRNIHMVNNSLGCMLGLLCGNAEIDIWSQLIKKWRRKRQG